MKRPFNWLVILCLTFLLSVTLTVLWFKSNQPLVSYEESLTKNVPSVEYCDLRNDPYRYDGKVVRLTADLYRFMHGYYLSDANCNDKFEDSGTDESKTAVLFYETYRMESFEYLEKFNESGKLWQPLKITVVGRFQYKRASGFSDGIEDRTSFHFEIYKVDSASR